MTAQPTTLADLKRAIEAIPPQPLPHGSLHDWVTFIDAREKAWRAAFEWREGWSAKMLAVMHRASGDISVIEEGAEGMNLIREKLR